MQFPTRASGRRRTCAVRHEDVAARAYELFIGRGGMHGADIDDWLQAEHDLETEAHARLNAYGEPLVSYHGRGALHFEDGRAEDVAFDVGQFANGDTLLLCSSEVTAMIEGMLMSWGGEEPDEAVRFSGIAAGGVRLESDVLFTTNYLPEMQKPGAYGAYETRELEARFPHEGDVAEYRFGLVNFHFTGTHGVTVNRQGLKHYATGIPVQLVVSGTEHAGVIVPSPGASREHLRLITQKSHAVMSELIIAASNGLDPADVTAAVDDLCLVLSVARGTRVRAIYREELTAPDGHVKRIVHRSRVVKRYCPLAPFSDDYNGREATQRFINNGLRVLPALRQRYAVDRGLVDAYLDAKAEADFLETRGTKIAAAIEKLKTEFLRGSPLNVSEFIIPTERFESALDSLQAAAVGALVESGVDRATAERMASEDRLRGLNRASFGQVIKALKSELSLDATSNEVDLFVASRNHLVHTGQFYCDSASAEQRRKLRPLPDARKEFFFLVSFMDRLFLKLFGYSGTYTNWRNFPAKDLTAELR